MIEPFAHFRTRLASWRARARVDSVLERTTRVTVYACSVSRGSTNKTVSYHIHILSVLLHLRIKILLLHKIFAVVNFM